MIGEPLPRECAPLRRLGNEEARRSTSAPVRSSSTSPAAAIRISRPVSSVRRSNGRRWPPCSGRMVRWSSTARPTTTVNEFRKDIEANYKHEIDESKQEAEELPGLGLRGHDGRDDGRQDEAAAG